MNTLTERQTNAMRDVVSRAAAHGVTVPEDIRRWDTVTWHEETRPGRGHLVSALHFDDMYFVQMLMDVYGYPTLSICTYEPIHNDSDDECDCDLCETERARENDLINDDHWNDIKEGRR